MNKLLQAVAAKTYQLCRTYPGGIRAMFSGMRERHGLSESSVYADLNPNNGQSTLRVWELVRVMEATGEHGPLRELANWFGYSLASAADEEPDAPTLEGEALQDYPPLVAFHEGCKLYRQGKIKMCIRDRLRILPFFWMISFVRRIVDSKRDSFIAISYHTVTIVSISFRNQFRNCIDHFNYFCNYQIYENTNRFRTHRIHPLYRMFGS